MRELAAVELALIGMTLLASMFDGEKGGSMFSGVVFLATLVVGAALSFVVLL